jgi:hypothetical protein
MRYEKAQKDSCPYAFFLELFPLLKVRVKRRLKNALSLSVLANQKTALISVNTHSPQETYAWVIDHGEFESGALRPRDPIRRPETNENRVFRFNVFMR